MSYISDPFLVPVTEVYMYQSFSKVGSKFIPVLSITEELLLCCLETASCSYMMRVERNCFLKSSIGAGA
jgi:hypothetical protein